MAAVFRRHSTETDGSAAYLVGVDGDRGDGRRVEDPPPFGGRIHLLNVAAKNLRGRRSTEGQREKDIYSFDPINGVHEIKITKILETTRKLQQINHNETPRVP